MLRRRRHRSSRDITLQELLEAGYRRVDELVELQRRAQRLGADLLVRDEGYGGYVYRLVGGGPTVSCSTLEETAHLVTRLEQRDRWGR